MNVQFGDLPHDAQAMLTKHLRIDFSMSDFKAPRWFSAWARNDRGHITGIFAVEFKYWFEGYVTVLVLDPRCMSRRVLRAIFTAAFTQARRLTAEVEPHNRRALRQVQRMGFVFEGTRRLGLEGTRDVFMYGMLKNECRYLPGYVPPPLPQLDVADSALRDAVISTDGRPATGVSPNSQYLFGSKPRHLIALAALGVGVVGAFGDVFLTSFPADMLRADAARRGAAMGGVMPLAGRPAPGLPVRQLAENAVHFPAGAVPAHLRVAVLVDGERPEQALVPRVENGGGEELHRGHVSGSEGYTRKGAVALVSVPVNRYKIRG